MRRSISIDFRFEKSLCDAEGTLFLNGLTSTSAFQARIFAEETLVLKQFGN